MFIRRATLDDAAPIAAVHITAWRETYAHIIPPSYLNRLDHAEKQRFWANILADQTPVYVATAQSRIVGFAKGGKNRDHTPYKGEIYTLYLLKDFHKQGIGTLLFDSITQYLWDQKLIPFMTWVIADNPALGFYRRKGGLITSEIFDDFDGHKIKELQLAWNGCSLPKP